VQPSTIFGNRSRIDAGGMRGGDAARWRAGTVHNAAAAGESNSRTPRTALAAT